MLRMPALAAALALALGLSSGTARAQPGMQSGVQTPDPAVAPGGPSEPEPVKSGLLHQGISVELLDLGAMQVHAPGGTVHAVDLGIGFRYELDAHWVIRVPIELGAGGFGTGAGYGELAILPGVLYQVRDHADQHGVPYLGAGARFGFASIGKTLVGQPIAIACCHDWFDDSHSGKGDPNSDDVSVTDGAPSVELWAGYAWNVSRWFALELDGALGYERLVGKNVYLVRETLGIRVTL